MVNEGEDADESVAVDGGVYRLPACRGCDSADSTDKWSPSPELDDSDALVS